MRDLRFLMTLPVVALVGLGAVVAASPPAAAGAAASPQAAAATGSAIAALATANLDKRACSPNSLGGKGFGSSCTGNSGHPEYWCADFAKWVWSEAGVADSSWLNALAGSFYTYGEEFGTLSSVPAVGDVVVFDYNGAGSADHDAIVTQVNWNGTIETVSGDWNGQSGTEARFASTSSVTLNTPAYLGVLGTVPDVMGMTISGFVAPVGRARGADPRRVVDIGQRLVVTGPRADIPNGRYTLTMQSDGNLVEDTGTRALWSTGTAGNPGPRAVVQPGGNFIVYSPSGIPLWWSYTGGHSGNVALVVRDDGNLMVHGPSGPLWTSHTQTDILTAGQALLAGQQLVSENGLYNLTMQADGNLVEKTAGRALWPSETAGHPGARAIMQPGGNLVVYGLGGAPLWWSASSGHSGSIDLVLQDDAKLVVHGPSGSLWANFA